MLSILTRKNKQAGFTLIEVMVVLAIIGIVSAIAVPSYFSRKPKYDLNKAVRDYYNLLQKAKITAIKDRGSCEVSFSSAPLGYSVVCDDRNPATCQATNSCTFVKNINIATAYNRNITLRSSVPPLNTKKVKFNSMGESQVGSPIIFFRHPNVSEQYRVNALVSGAIKLMKI